MKFLTFTIITLFAAVSFALPEGGVECHNDIQNVGDGYMYVKLVDGMATFSFWESGYEPVAVTTAGADVFAIVEEKVTGSGEGQTWVDIFSAFMVYKWQTNELHVTTVWGENNVRTETLSCD